MRNLSILILIAALFAACSSSTSSDDDNNEETSTAAVLTFEAQEQRGTSTLTRTDDGVSYSISASGMTPGDAVTLWMVIFNNPEHCDPAGCGEPDLFVEDVVADVVFGGDGHVISATGEATFTGSRNVGQNGGSIMGEWLGLPENGLLDTKKAEIHLILHSHGPVIDELEEEMTSTFNAGCGEFFFPEGEAPPVPESLGTYGPNTCTDYAFAVHPQSEEY